MKASRYVVAQGLVIFGFAAIVTLIAGCASVGSGLPTDAGRQGEIVYPESEETVPVGKVLSLQFTLTASVDIKVEYRIQPGRDVNLYLMTREQHQRAVAGAEPRQPGRDFIQLGRGIVGQGSMAQGLTPGEYTIVFRNVDDNPVRIWTRAIGYRN